MIELLTGCDIDYYMSQHDGYCIMDKEKIPLVYIMEVIDACYFDDREGFYITAGVMPGSKDDDDILDDVHEHGFIPVNLNAFNPDTIEFEKFEDGWIVQEPEIEKALEMAEDRAVPTFGLIGFILDGPVNRIGQTGWDWIKMVRGKETFHEWLQGKLAEIN